MNKQLYSIKEPYSMKEIAEYLQSKALVNETTECYITKETKSTILITFKRRRKNTILCWMKPKLSSMPWIPKKKEVIAYA